MTAQTYFVGLDLILDDTDKGLKVLEMQSLFECDYPTAIKLTGKDPRVLIKSVKNVQANLDIPDPSNTDEKARAASLKGDENTIPNRGIEPMLRMKYLFYLFCTSDRRLADYIPTTDVVTSDTLSCANVLSTPGLTLLKPADGTRGSGITLLPQTLPFSALKNYINKQHIKYMESRGIPASVLSTFPLVLQRYLHDGNPAHPISKRAIRVYAAVTIDDTGKIGVAIDLNSAYERVRKEENNTDFTSKNNQYMACKFGDEKDVIKEKIGRFLYVFFTVLLEKNSYPSSKNNISYKCWEELLKKYMTEGEQMEPPNCLHLVSLFAAALQQEQRFTANKLSDYRLTLLTNFIKQFSKNDSAACVSVLPFLTNAIKVLVKQNFLPYLTDATYNFGSVIEEYEKMLSSLPKSSSNHALLEDFRTVHDLIRESLLETHGLKVGP